jgi:hypothetical protein
MGWKKSSPLVSHPVAGCWRWLLWILYLDDEGSLGLDVEFVLWIVLFMRPWSLQFVDEVGACSYRCVMSDKAIYAFTKRSCDWVGLLTLDFIHFSILIVEDFLDVSRVSGDKFYDPPEWTGVPGQWKVFSFHHQVPK